MAIEMQKVKEKARRITRIILWSGLVVAILAAAGYYFWRTYTVSDGTRTGTLYKISRKGYVFKTYEGELQLAGTDMMTQLSVWSFSASDAAVADQLREHSQRTRRSRRMTPGAAHDGPVSVHPQAIRPGCLSPLGTRAANS